MSAVDYLPWKGSNGDGILCPHCDGVGYTLDRNEDPVECKACDGTGVRREGRYKTFLSVDDSCT